MRLVLEEHEAMLLRQVLTHYLGDLRMEISSTDRMDFREKLKDEERFLKRLIDDLTESPVPN